MANCHCRLTSLRSVEGWQSVRSLSEDASKTLVHAFVSCRVDYCNSVLRHLRKTDESVAVGSKRRRPSSYWYSTFRPHNADAPSATLAIVVRQTVDFKVATLVHRSLSGISSSYLAHDCLLVSDARGRRLCSKVSRTL